MSYQFTAYNMRQLLPFSAFLMILLLGTLAVNNEPVQVEPFPSDGVVEENIEGSEDASSETSADPFKNISLRLVLIAGIFIAGIIIGERFMKKSKNIH